MRVGRESRRDLSRVGQERSAYDSRTVAPTPFKLKFYKTDGAALTPFDRCIIAIIVTIISRFLQSRNPQNIWG